MYSSKKHPDHVLVGKLSHKQLDRLLVDWANLPDLSSGKFDDAARRLFDRYPQLFREFLGSESWDDAVTEEVRDDLRRSIGGIREYIRTAWDSADVRHRTWYIGALRFLGQKHKEAFQAASGGEELRKIAKENFGVVPERSLQAGAQGFWKRVRFWGQWVEPCPPKSSFEELTFHFLRISERLRHCSNQDCPAPYFLNTRKGQKYCSLECSAPAQREAKRRWWHENRGKK